MGLGFAAVRRWFGRALFILLVLVLILAGSFLIAPTRGLWLAAGLELAGRSLPGELSGEWSWPRLNRIECRDLLWTAPVPGKTGGDTLAVVPRLAVQVDLKALRSHDLLVDELKLQASRLDVPLIMAHMPAPAEPVAAADTSYGMPFLRQGSVPGFPSAAVRRMVLSVDRLVLPDQPQVSAVSVSGSGSALSDDPPRLVLESFGAQATVVAADSLGINAGSFGLDAHGDWLDGVWKSQASVRFNATLAEDLMDRIPGKAISGFSGRMDLRCRGNASEMQADAALDLDPTDDIERCRISGSLLAGLQPQPVIRQVRVDTLDVEWRRTTVAAGGFWDRENVEAWAAADLQDLEVPLLFSPEPLPGVDGRISMQVDVAGPVDSPRISGKILAAVGAESVWDLPGVSAAAANLPPEFPRDDFRRVDIDLQAGFAGSAEDLALDLRADLGRTPWLDRGLFSGRVLVAPRIGALSDLQIDTLAVALRGADLMASGRADTIGADLAVALTIAGTGLLDAVSPGKFPAADLGLAADLRLVGPWRDIQAEADLNGSLETADLSLSELSASVRGSAESLRVRAQAGRGVRFGTVTVDSVDVAWDGSIDPAGGIPGGSFDVRVRAPQASAWLRATAAGDSVRTVSIDTLAFTAAGQTINSVGPTTLMFGPGQGEFTLDGLRMRGDLGSLDIDHCVFADGLALNAATDLLLTREWLDTLFPSPFWSASGGIDLAVDCDIDLSTAAEDELPVFKGRAGLSLVPRNEEPPARLDMDFRLAKGDTAGLVVGLGFRVGDTHLLNGSLLWPGRIDPQSRRWLPGEGAAGGISIPEQELPLGFLNRFMPAEVSLDGILTFGAGLAMARSDSVAVAVTESDVNARIRAKGLRVNLPNRSRVEVEGEIDVEGKLIDPRLAGEVVVANGLFRLPETQRSLFPVRGNSALWTADRQAAGDTGVADRRPLWTVDAAVEEPSLPYIPDLDLRVAIPGNFKVIGYGLEIELAGDLRISRGIDRKGRAAPVMRGQVRVVEGTLHALNRVFEVEHGVFELQGRIPADPEVNLVMVTEIDGTVVRIRVTGTALQPVIVLESDPEMIQADIMAFLLFGRPFNDLDTDQRGSMNEEQTPAQQLSRNLQGLALVFGAAGIQNTMSGKIGVDQVQIGSDTAGGSALVLGKFINPRTLLKYHQSLERSGTYFMTLEYTISRIFKLISTYGQGEEASGLELRWLRRY